MQSHVYRFPAKHGQPVRWFLCGDLHLGHVGCNVARIKREFKRAVDLGANILINGDVYDAIGSKDKRATPGQTIRRLSEAKDKLKESVDLGEEVLGEFRENIRVIGIGNHEETWIRYQESDPVAGLIDRLNQGRQHPQPIRHGGIAGYVVSLLDIPSGKGKPLTISHTLHYHHGSGGDAPITGGLIAANRSMVSWIADAHTEGHRHNQLQREYAVGTVRPNGRVVIKQCVCIMTGSYLDNYPRGERAKPLEYTYAESANHPPKPMGGQFLLVTPERIERGNAWRIRQDYHSALMPTAVVA
jgi:hypothetical protein